MLRKRTTGTIADDNASARALECTANCTCHAGEYIRWPSEIRRSPTISRAMASDILRRAYPFGARAYVYIIQHAHTRVVRDLAATGDTRDTVRRDRSRRAGKNLLSNAPYRCAVYIGRCTRSCTRLYMVGVYARTRYGRCREETRRRRARGVRHSRLRFTLRRAALRILPLRRSSPRVARRVVRASRARSAFNVANAASRLRARMMRRAFSRNR